MNILVNLGLKWFEVKIPDYSFIVVPKPPPSLNGKLIWNIIYMLYIRIHLDSGSGLYANTCYYENSISTIMEVNEVEPLKTSPQSTLCVFKQTFQYFGWLECSQIFIVYSPMS